MSVAKWVIAVIVFFTMIAFFDSIRVVGKERGLCISNCVYYLNGTASPSS